MSRGPLRVLSHLPLALLGRVREAVPDVELAFVPGDSEPPPELEGEVLLTLTWGAPNLPQLLERGVRWVHTFGTGVDRFPIERMGERVLTCARGASAVPIAEWVLAMMLAFEKRLPETWLHEPPERWNWAELGSLRGRRLAILGLGSIGSSVAQRALPFGMTVRALRRRRLPSPVPAVELARDLPDLLASADHLVLAASTTASTRGILGREALAAVKPGLHLVNVARGALVDLAALREALDDGRVARASLDTVEPEPLPAGHWLYAHPRVRLSAHVSWSAPGALDELVESFAANLRRYRDGEPLEGVVDPGEGY